jgi:hypothetical protein
MELLKKVLPHLCVIFAGMFVILFIIDNLNSAMSVLDNSTIKLIMFIFSIIAIIVSCMLIARQRREN